MAGQGAYADVRAVVAPTGRIYLFSEKHLIALEATELGRAEEAKHAIVERIRQDSSGIVLTRPEDLEALYPFPEPERRAALLEELRADPRFQDVQQTTGPDGQVFWHSEKYVSGNYATIMMRAKAGDALVSIAEFVRERSRNMPATVPVSQFEDPVFGIDFLGIEAKLEELARLPAYADIRRLVHPETGAVHLYSSRHLQERRAFELMDWVEVGALRNP
jgi:hypothetical protein